MAAKRARRAPRATPTREMRARPVLEVGEEWRDAWVTGDDVVGSCDELWISGCVVRDVRFTESRLGALHADNTIFERCDFTGVDASSLDAVQCEWRDCRMDAIDLSGARLLDVAFERCTLRDASLRHANLQHVSLVEVTLPRADLTEATFEHVLLERCDLTAALFWHASLAGTAFPGCRLDGVRGGTAFRGTRLEVAQILDVAPTVFEGLGIEIVDD